MEQMSVFLALPRYGAVEFEVAMGVMQASRQHQLAVRPHEFSILTFNFNSLWCEALNRRKELGLTHFAMMHSDIAPEPFWLDTLIEEQQRIGADVLSTVVRIKDPRGLTSTGIYQPVEQYVRRFTVKELAQMPATFTAADTGNPDKALAINTGLWVCDFTKPWVENICFAVLDMVHKRPDGTFFATNFPEDWHFSLQCHNLGLKVAATTLVKNQHWGRIPFASDEICGLETEQGDVL